MASGAAGGKDVDDGSRTGYFRPLSNLGKRHRSPHDVQLNGDVKKTLKNTPNSGIECIESTVGLFHTLGTVYGKASLRGQSTTRRSVRPTDATNTESGNDCGVRKNVGNDDDDELNLYCAETLSPSRATDDRKRVDGGHLRRVLGGLLEAESGYQLQTNPYDGRIQPEITNGMRGELAHWIYEICESNISNGGVFPLTMHLIDCFLSLPSLHRRVRAKQFQLIGAVCLFVASKFIDCSEETCLTASQIVRYADSSFTKTQLMDWELTILQAFNWDLFAITPFDFVDHILCHLTLGCDVISSRVRHHTVTFITLCAYDVNFSTNHPPSTVAAACLRQAASVTLGEDWCRANLIDNQLFEITRTEPDYVTACRHQIERAMFDRYEAGLQLIHGPDSTTDGIVNNGIDPKHQVVRATPETPTDIRDISPDCGPLSRIDEY